jgi:hypothetical protein
LWSHCSCFKIDIVLIVTYLSSFIPVLKLSSEGRQKISPQQDQAACRGGEGILGLERRSWMGRDPGLGRKSWQVRIAFLGGRCKERREDSDEAGVCGHKERSKNSPFF